MKKIFVIILNIIFITTMTIYYPLYTLEAFINFLGGDVKFKNYFDNNK